MASHRVRFEPQGRTVQVDVGRAILDAALAAGLNLPHSCKSGHCASCRARLASGTVSYPAGRPPGLMAEEEASGLILLCQARATSALVVEARVIRHVTDVEIKTLPCRIDAREFLAPDVLRLRLRLPAIESFEFQAGQYLDVLLDNGRRRSFSIASPPHDAARLELHVRRVPGGGFTEALFAQVGPGGLLRIEGPIGQFVYTDAATPVIFVAGGTGYAPVKSMLRHALERGTARDIAFFWGARQAIDLYEAALVGEWAARHPRFTFTGVLSERADSRHERGFVHEAVLARHPDLSAFEVYAAGPPAMIEAIRASFPAHGLAPGRLHFDSFDYAPR
ncbi:MAG: CDP-6-deoxy-L-threo-D-glycero-4-hexulose-3-dehydrase reductase [Steroidobacteraceae bacterium]|nr:CDP-6-deoxy-L-threo-D-glycero-4-hexulose-3-dehydrase reductase [Steroidobacteraceae bacterium]